VLFAEVLVTGDPEDDPSRRRWRWSFPIEARLAVEDLRAGPPVEAARIFPSSLGRHSYVRLTPEGFADGREAIRGAH
jgi:hypothetical protein